MSEGLLLRQGQFQRTQTTWEAKTNEEIFSHVDKLTQDMKDGPFFKNLFLETYSKFQPGNSHLKLGFKDRRTDLPKFLITQAKFPLTDLKNFMPRLPEGLSYEGTQITSRTDTADCTYVDVEYCFRRRKPNRDLSPERRIDRRDERRHSSTRKISPSPPPPVPSRSSSRRRPVSPERNESPPPRPSRSRSKTQRPPRRSYSESPPHVQTQSGGMLNFVKSLINQGSRQ